jgi:hypothetical protein
MLSNVKQYLIRKTRVTLSLLVVVLLLALMVKLSSCTDIILDENLYGDSYKWNPDTGASSENSQPYITVDSVEVDSTFVPTVWCHVHYDSIMVITDVSTTYWTVAETVLEPKTIRLALLDTVDFETGKWHAYAIRLDTLDREKVYTLYATAHYLDDADTLQITSAWRWFQTNE